MSKHYEDAISKFDRDILRVVAMCEDLQREVNKLDHERKEVGSGFSAKLLSNEKISFFVSRYSEIVHSYEAACKEFSRIDSDLEKIMHIEGDAQELISDVKQSMNEIESKFNFKLEFDDADLFIFEALSPVLSRIIEVGKAIHIKAHDALASFTPKNSKFDEALYKILKGCFWLLPGGGAALLMYGFFTKHEGSLALGSIMAISSLILFSWLKWEKRKDGRTEK